MPLIELEIVPLKYYFAHAWNTDMKCRALDLLRWRGGPNKCLMAENLSIKLAAGRWKKQKVQKKPSPSCQTQPLFFQLMGYIETLGIYLGFESNIEARKCKFSRRLCQKETQSDASSSQKLSSTNNIRARRLFSGISEKESSLLLIIVCQSECFASH